MKPRWKRNLPLYALIAITILPIVAAYIAYYVLPPSARTNYGTLIEPQRPTPALPLRNLDGSSFCLQELQGKWVFVMIDGGECDQRCADKLLMMRQQRAMTGKSRDQIERVWLITDDAPLPIMLMREYEGTHFVRAPLQPVRSFLALPPAADARLEDHIWVIDPSGNLMLRWPKNPDVNGIKRDVAKLLKVAAGWIRIDPRGQQ
ncbi:MAG: SCO family protein [Burkholderiaceae bacterium]